MTNTTLRERFGIDSKNSALASRIIRDTVEQGLIRLSDPSASRKYSKYIGCSSFSVTSIISNTGKI